MVTGESFLGDKAAGMWSYATHLHLVPKLRMCGVIPPVAQSSSWLSSKLWAPWPSGSLRPLDTHEMRIARGTLSHPISQVQTLSAYFPQLLKQTEFFYERHRWKFVYSSFRSVCSTHTMWQPHGATDLNKRDHDDRVWKNCSYQRSG